MKCTDYLLLFIFIMIAPALQAQEVATQQEQATNTQNTSEKPLETKETEQAPIPTEETAKKNTTEQLSIP